MVQVDEGAVPRAVDENQVTARLQHVEILSLIAQSEGPDELERFAHSLRGTPQDGVPAVTDAPAPDRATVALVAEPVHGFEDEPATRAAFEPEGEPFDVAAMLSDGVPVVIEAPERSRTQPVAPRSRVVPVIVAVMLALLGAAAYAAYARLL